MVLIRLGVERCSPDKVRFQSHKSGTENIELFPHKQIKLRSEATLTEAATEREARRVQESKGSAAVGFH